MMRGDIVARRGSGAQQAGRSKQRPYEVLADIEALPSRLPTLYRRLTE